MSQTYKRLAATFLTASGNTQIYQVPSGSYAILGKSSQSPQYDIGGYVHAVNLCNVSVNTYSVRVAHVDGPLADLAQADWIYSGANELATSYNSNYLAGRCMSGGDSVVVSAGSGVAVSVWGVEITDPGTEIPKRLGATTLTSGVNTALYTVPSGKSAIIDATGITGVNRNSGSVSLIVAAIDGAVGDLANEDYLMYGQWPWAGSGSIWGHCAGLTMAAGMTLMVRTNRSNVDVSVAGLEIG